MKKSLLYTYGILILLTISTAFLSNSNVLHVVLVALILGISAIKILVVAFQFMELKKANSFWKYTLSIVLVLIIVILYIIIAS